MRPNLHHGVGSERRGRILTLFLFLVGCGACSSAEDLSSSTSHPLAILVGTGDIAFRELAENENVEIIAGPQGGHHIWISTRISGLDPRSVQFEFGVTDEESEQLLSVDSLQLISPMSTTSEGRWYDRSGLLAVLEQPAEDVHGRTVILWVNASDAEGVSVHGEQHVLATYQP